MNKLNLDKNIKELLTAYNVPNDVIKLIENHYNELLTDIVNELKNESEKDREKKNNNDVNAQSKPNNISDLAKELRLIK